MLLSNTNMRMLVTGIGFVLGVGLSYITGLKLSEVLITIAFLAALDSWAQVLFFKVYAKQQFLKKETDNASTGTNG